MKMHFIDLFIYKVISLCIGVKVPGELIIVKGVVTSCLAKISDVGYTTVGNREIDVIALSDFTGYEVKYGRRSER